MDDNSTVIVTFFTKPWMVSPLPFDPYLAIAITTPNGTTFIDEIHVSTDQFLAAHAKQMLPWMRTGYVAIQDLRTTR
jgi:hypothetical protein